MDFVAEGEVMEGQRRGSRIIHANGFSYYRNRARPNRRFVYLRCIKRRTGQCLGKAAIPVHGGRVRITHVHNHLPDNLHPQVLALRSAILRRVRAGDPSPFSQIVMEEGLRGHYNAAVRARVTVVRMRSSLRNARMLLYPLVPRNLGVLGALLSMPQYSFISRTMDEEDNMFAGMCGKLSERTLSVVFISARMREFMQSVRKVFCDGTFKSTCRRPKCHQIFNIVSSWRNHVIPLLRAIMQSRKAKAYIVLFEFIKTLMPNFEPRFVMCDFEKAEIKAWYFCFPAVVVVNCLWHYAVAIFRHSRMLGYVPLMLENDAAASIIRSMCAIPLLPTHLLRDGVVCLVMEAYSIGLFEDLYDLFEYLVREWLPRSRSLSVCGVSDRTNNCSESANRCLNAEVRQTHPNVWQLLRAFARLEDRARVDIATLTDGAEASRPRRVSALSNDARINALTRDLLNGDVAVLDFLHRASRSMQGVYEVAFEGR